MGEHVICLIVGDNDHCYLFSQLLETSQVLVQLSCMVFPVKRCILLLLLFAEVPHRP